MTPDHQSLPWNKIQSPNPLTIPNPPLIAKLHTIGFHRFRKRWTRRLFKKPARALFDFGYHVLKLGGQGIIEFRCANSVRNLEFDARKLHFSSIYRYSPEQVFEPQVMGLLELLMRDKDVFVDVGANWGMEALHAAVLPNWTGEIHAFEPVPDTFADLNSLVSQASLEGRIKFHNIALSDDSGPAVMVLADGIQSGTATLTKLRYGFNGIDVQREKLDKLKIPAPRFIKLDVEGHEAAVLCGAKKTLARNRPFIIFKSWHTPEDYQNSANTFQVLHDYGYVFFRPAWRRTGDGRDCVWPHTQPPSPENRELSLIPMDPRLRPFMAEHIDIFACHADGLNELKARLKRKS